MLVQWHDKSWHFPFLIQCFLCKQPRFFCVRMCSGTRAGDANKSHVMVNFIICSQTQWPQTKGGNGRRYANHLLLKDAWRKRPYKPDSFFLLSVLSTIQLKTGTQTMDFCKRSDPSLNPIQVVHMKHRRNIAMGGLLSDLLDKHKDSSMPLKWICWKANLLE